MALIVPVIAEEVGLLGEIAEGVVSVFSHPAAKLVGLSAAGSGVYDLTKHAGSKAVEIVQPKIHQLMDAPPMRDERMTDLVSSKRKYTDVSKARYEQSVPTAPQKKYVIEGTTTNENSREHRKTDNVLTHFNTKSLTLTDTNSMTRATGIPKTTKVTHRWCCDLSDKLVMAIGQQQGAVAVCANSIEGPGAVGGLANTTNAVLFSQYASFYDRYMVTGATIRWDYLNDMETGVPGDSHGLIVGIGLKDDASVSTDLKEYIASNEAVWKPISAEQTGTIVAHVKPAQFFGSKAPSSDSTLHVDAATSPIDGRAVNSLFFHLFTWSPTAISGSAKGPRGIITIDYDVVWMEPRMIVAQDSLDPSAGTTIAINTGR